MRRVEIAGAGFAGLVASIALAERGWQVRVHEKSSFVRAEGFGLSTQENMLKVLEALGVREQVVAGGQRIVRRKVLDDSGRTLMETADRSNDQTARGYGYRISRSVIIAILLERARKAGVEIITDSPVAGADPAGALLLSDGRRLEADLIIGSDGINSAVRDSLDLQVHRTLRNDGALRVLVPQPPVHLDPSEDGATRESWSGSRRFIISRTKPDERYVAMSCLASDETGVRTPIDVASWSATFPALGPFFAWMLENANWTTGRWVRFQTLRLSSWHSGKVAVVGDAAHAMPPDLGQGAGCAMMNALSLAVHAPDLAAWEAAERPLTEHTQRWAGIYGAATNLPGPLRSLAFQAIGRVPWLRNRYQRTARHVPTGYVAP